MLPESKPDVLAPLHAAILDDVHARHSASVPAGAESFALPALPDLGPFVQAASQIAIDQVIATFGGTLEDAVEAYGATVREFVSDQALEFAQRLVGKLRG